MRARLVLSSYVRTCVILTSYVRDRVRARLRSLVGVTLLGFFLIIFDRKVPCALLCNFLFEAVNFANLFFVRRNFDKFSTILASIVFYDVL